MFDRTIEPDPRPAAPQSRAIYSMRDGHRREYDASRDRGSISFRERCRGALADIGIYGAVSYRDLAEARFGGHPYTTRRAVNAWIREGLAQETRATGPNRQPVQGPDAHAQGSGRHPRPGRRARPGPRTAHQVRRSPPPTRPARARHGHLPGLRPRTPTLARAGRRHPARTARRRAQERCRAPERVRACERRPPGRGRRAAPCRRRARPPHRRAGTRALPRCADRVHRRRRAERARQRRGRVGPLPPGICPGQGRSRVPDARKRAGRSAGA